MSNKKYSFLVLVFVIGLILVMADFLILFFFDHAFEHLITRIGLPGLAFIIINILIMGRFAKSFAPEFFQNTDSKQLGGKFKAMGGTPLKVFAMNILFHTIFLTAVFMPKGYLHIDPAIKNSLFMAAMSLGMLISTFIYVITDGLVSRTLIAYKISKYPRDLREKRQSLKLLLVPFITTAISLVFGVSVMLIGISLAGGTVNKIQFSVVLIPVIICFVTIFGLAMTLRKNSIMLYAAIIEQLENLSSEKKDLTKRISICSVDELGTVAGMVNDFCEQMSSGIGEIKSGQNELTTVSNKLEENATDMAASIVQITGAAEQVLGKTRSQKESVNTSSAAIHQIAKSIEALEQSIVTQASSMTEASAAVEQMIGNISSIGSVTEKMASQFKTVGQAAEEGSQIQKGSGERINEIVEQSKALQEANKIIATIAAQTNLLAMNAAIEAAHAGEAGRGFSVVADEIRKLAENSSKESQKIGSELKQIVQTIGQIVRDAEVSGNAFTEVSNKVSETEKLVTEVNNAIHEQKTGAGQVIEALKIMNDITVKVRDGSREMSQGNESMLKEVSSLQGSASDISSSMEEMSGGIRTINNSAQDVSNLANTTRSSIHKISVIANEYEV